MRLNDLRIVVAHGGRAHDDVRVPDILSAVAFKDLNAWTHLPLSQDERVVYKSITPIGMSGAVATDASGKALDCYYAVRFGFREFWIDGKDFYLNGSRIFLSAVPLDNAQLGDAPTG